jgi:peptide chain release factor
MGQQEKKLFCPTLTRLVPVFSWVPGRAGPARRYAEDRVDPNPPSMNSHYAARLAAVGASPAEVDERFILGSGRGGQKVQKTSSTVALRHRPTGIEVRCQRERSQSQNRELAWNELCERLEQRLKAAKAEAIDAREAERRRTRQKSRGQKLRMIESKKRRAKVKARRGRADFD